MHSVTVWKGSLLLGEHGCVVAMHSVCALKHMDTAGASGLDFYLGLPKYDRDRWVDRLPKSAERCRAGTPTRG